MKKYSKEQVNSLLDSVERNVFLYLKICAIQSNVANMIKLNAEREMDDFLMLDLKSESDIYAAALADILLKIKATGAITDHVNQGYLRWHGDYLGKDICWSWRIGESSIKYWSKQSDSASLRFDIAN